MAPGIQLILPGDFQEGAWPVSGCQCANPWTKVSVQVFNLLFQMTDHLFTLVSRGCITLSRDLSRMVFTLRLLKGPKTRKSSEVSTIFALRSPLQV
ncbi:hypothetical protein NX026_30135, partial [Klebsiella pneumoniae]|nr:hypothetical protein [Klebsiella pneumoniae]